MPTPTFFNVRYNFDLGQDANGGYPYRIIRVDNCFFMKRDGTYVNTVEELNQLNIPNTEDLLIVRRSPQGNYDIPDIENFDTYPELFNPLNPDADRHGGEGQNQDIGANEPYKITVVTKDEIEAFSAERINVENGGKRKRKRKSKRRKQSKRRKFSKRMY